METRTINANHVELLHGHFRAAFSYGRACAFSFQGQVTANRDYYRFSPTTSRHVNASFPIIKSGVGFSVLDDHDFSVAFINAVSKLEA